MLSRSERSLRASAAAYARWSQHDTVAGTAPMRAGRWTKLLDAVDPDRVLAEGERVARAERLRKSQNKLASMKSVKVRAAKKAATSTKVTAQEVERASAHTTARAA